MRKHVIIITAVLTTYFLFGLITESRSQPYQVKDRPSESSSDQLIGGIGEGYFNFEIADDDQERTKGLSGREQMSDTDALLFVFEHADRHCFWMKDMKFSLDMLWFNAERKLIYMQQNVSPATFPETFCPNNPAVYVVEVAAGAANKNQLKLGDSLDVEL